MHFNDAVNLDLQKPDIIEYYNQMKSGVDMWNKMIGTYNMDRNTRRRPMVILYRILSIAGINAQTIHVLKSNVKIRHRIFIRNLIMQLLSEQIQRCSEISTGVHKFLHLKLHEFQTQMEGNSNYDVNMASSTSRKEEKDVLGAIHPKRVTYQNIFSSFVKNVYAWTIAKLFAMTFTNVLQSQLLKILIN